MTANKDFFKDGLNERVDYFNSCLLVSTADYFCKKFGPRSGLTNVRPDLGPNCLQKLSADDTSRQRVTICPN